MTNALIRKLEAFAPLPEEDRRLLTATTSQRRNVDAGVDLIAEGEAPSDVHLVLDGFACRYKLLPNGRRSIVGFLVPGDFCDLNVFILRAMDHNVSTLAPSTVVDIPRARILELMDRPAIARAFWWVGLVDEATLREWLVNLGARPAEARMAHLLCEVLVRLRLVGLTNDGAYDLPLTQTELADTMGMSTVHMNRVLQGLRARKLVKLTTRKVAILDVEALIAFSGFNADYLHLQEEGGAAEASR